MKTLAFLVVAMGTLCLLINSQQCAELAAEVRADRAAHELRRVEACRYQCSGAYGTLTVEVISHHHTGWICTCPSGAQKEVF